MASEFSGMPLLSGPPPPLDSPRADISCRRCNKEFNVIFTRARRCNHCGFSYCSTCSDYTALMPRAGVESGYDPVAVCAFCIDNLNVTAGSWQYLKNLPLSRLKQYVDAYNIKTPGVLEKDDIVRSIVASRGVNGCLSPAQEDFYRKYSVPNGRHGRPRGLFSNRQAPQPAQPQGRTATSAPAFARPDLEAGVTASHPSSVPPRRQTPAYQSASTQRPHPYVPPRGPPPPPRQSGTRSANVPPSRAAQANPAPSPPPPPAIVPTLDELLAMTGDALNALSISALKAILFQNHVNARLILEKSELVSRVRALIEDERREREREAAAHAQEEAEIIARQHAMMEEHRLREEARAAAGSSPSPVSSNRSSSPGHEPTSVRSPDIEMTSSEPTGAPKHTAAAAALERSGLCVVCQDEEANIAIVDCGHMAMCRSCSELVMSSSRECPLCRTRIVTEARLLRIFKT